MTVSAKPVGQGLAPRRATQESRARLSSACCFARRGAAGGTHARWRGKGFTRSRAGARHQGRRSGEWRAGDRRNRARQRNALSAPSESVERLLSAESAESLEPSRQKIAYESAVRIMESRARPSPPRSAAGVRFRPPITAALAKRIDCRAGAASRSLRFGDRARRSQRAGIWPLALRRAGPGRGERPPAARWRMEKPMGRCSGSGTQVAGVVWRSSQRIRPSMPSLLLGYMRFHPGPSGALGGPTRSRRRPVAAAGGAGVMRQVRTPMPAESPPVIRP